jgi:tRNA threonylcarbamoyladenosine biosynthesis protein TsaB
VQETEERCANLLAIDASTALGSLALFRGDALAARAEWEDERGRNQELIPVLRRLLRDAAVAPAEIDVFAVGLGPGSFSGLRVSLSAARAMALPGGRTVCGVSSAEALAAQTDSADEREDVIVIGDARRNRFWAARFHRSGGRLQRAAGFSLIVPADLGSFCSGRVVVVTSDWGRIGNAIAIHAPAAARLVRERRVPGAADVGRLVLERRRRGEPGDPLNPIYLHPPVFVAPRQPPADAATADARV